MSISPSSASRQAGNSAAGSANAIEPPKRAAIADRGMADVRHRPCNQRRVPCDDVGALGLRMARERADLDGAVLDRDAVEAVDAVDIDQQSGCRQPHIERGDQALPAGQQPRVLCLPSSVTRLVERARLSCMQTAPASRVLPFCRRVRAFTASRAVFLYCDRERGQVNAGLDSAIHQGVPVFNEA